MIFSICEQFPILLREAGMKVSVLDLFQQWYEIVDYVMKTFSRRSFVSSHIALNL